MDSREERSRGKIPQTKTFSLTFVLLRIENSGIMNRKIPWRGEPIKDTAEPALAEMLFAALSEHEATLARVSRLLHDDVSQVLSAAGLQLDALKMDFRDTAPGVDQRAVEIQCMLEQAIERLRDISNELNPSIAERAGLHFALDQMVGKARETFPGAVRLHFDSAARTTPAQAKIFYKIADYAVETAMGRPGCSLIDIQVKQSHRRIVLEVADNGAFQDADGSEKPLGTLLIEYYAAKSQFELSRNGSADNGNLLRATSPANDPVTN
jgi:signal transduction histidine kinase